MTKINVFRIISAHYKTLFDGDMISNLAEAVIFLLLPVLAGWCFFEKQMNIGNELRDLLVTVYTIFSALLFSSQIGLFALKRNDDFSGLPEIEKQNKKDGQDNYNNFLQQFSSNISYLILISVISLMIFILENLLDPLSKAKDWTLAFDALLICLTVHFFISLLMVLKRFSTAYSVT